MKTKLQFNFISIGLILSILISVNSYAQINWDKSEWNPVITYTPGNWNYNVYSPVVIFEESIFKMWFSAYYSGNYNVGYTESEDGINWTLPELVIPYGQPGEWDRWKSPRTILRINDTLKMWFHATPNSTDIYSIGYAWSVNDNVWNFYSEPVLDIGPAGSWDESLVYDPSVYFDGELYHMWYSGSMNNATYDQIGYAVSDDGINWIKDELYNPVIALGDPGTFYDTYVQAGPVILHNGIYQMWFGGYDGNQFEIGYATSPDKINWTVQDITQPVVPVGLPGSWDDEAIHEPAVIIHDGIYKMWYGGWGDVRQIGYAEGDSVVITSTHDFTMDMDVNMRIFPNPVTQHTKIRFYLSSDIYTELYIYNSVGKKIKVITSENLRAGKHEIVLNGSGFKPGVYFCVLKTNEGIQTKKIIKYD